MSYKITEEGNISTVFLDGEIDMDVTEKAKEVILPLVESGKVTEDQVIAMASDEIKPLDEQKNANGKKVTRSSKNDLNKNVNKKKPTSQKKRIKKKRKRLRKKKKKTSFGFQTKLLLI